MKSNIAIALSIVALVVSLVGFFNKPEESFKPNVIELQEEKYIDGDSGIGMTSEGESIWLGLIFYMNNLQRHANKLWFAGNAENWELAAFYVEELEESMDAVVKANVVEDGIALTPLMKNMGLISIDGLEKAIEKKDVKSFITAYDLLISNCNSCHHSSNHSFIKIKRPETPVYDNQVYGAKL